jgi:hypothetical protein
MGGDVAGEGYPGSPGSGGASPYPELRHAPRLSARPCQRRQLNLKSRDLQNS